MIFRFLVLILFIGINASGQVTRIKNNDLFKTLYRDQFGPISIVQHELIRFFNIKDNSKINYPHRLLKQNGKLYIIVERTGRIYEIENSKNDSVEIKRIDSTHFYGYNGAAILFTHNDTIFSFGGNGFWHINGQLRYFSFSNHEWEITHIDKEIPCLHTLFYQDNIHKYLYYITLPYVDEATGEKRNHPSVNKLDLIARTNTELGEIPENILKLLTERQYHYSFVSLSGLGGLLVNFDINNQYLFLFGKNELYKLNNEKIRNIFFGDSDTRYPIFLFSKKEYIYYTKNFDPDYKVDSLKIGMNDFVKVKYPIYDIPIETYKKEIAFSCLFLLIISSVFIYIRRKNKKSENSSIVKNESIEDFTLSFNNIEKDLIDKLIEASKANRKLTVEEINTVLGLAKKSLEIQKKVRTEAINRINHKFKVIYDVKVDLIERIRSEEDRRFYKYIISEENMKKISDRKKEKNI